MSPTRQAPFLGLHTDELAGVLGGTGRARQPWKIVRAGGDPFQDLPEPARGRLRSRCRGGPDRIVAQRVSPCGTTKIALRLDDGLTVESVVIPGDARTTVCVSSQVGCGRGCVFCVTATLGRVRNLSTAEIVAQVVLGRDIARRGAMPEVSNVVFMGMGEPLDNLEATGRSVAILTDPHALALAPRRITVSTVGTSPRAVAALADIPARVAWSLHAVDPDLRRMLIPTAKHDPIELREAFAPLARNRRCVAFVEVALMDDVNDSDACARALCDFLAPLTHVRVNLLPMNPGRIGLRPSPPARVAAFRQILWERGVFCTLRRPRGADDGAACGQLVGTKAPRALGPTRPAGCP